MKLLERTRSRFLGDFILATISCPILLPWYLEKLLKVRQAQEAKDVAGVRYWRTALYQQMRMGVMFSMVLLTIIAVVIFWAGGSVLPFMASFY